MSLFWNSDITMNNEELKKTYDEFHKVGVSSWFSDGKEERETILKMGEPWDKECVLEIGCGEGDLGQEISRRCTRYLGVDYSEEAIIRALEKYGVSFDLAHINYRELTGKFDRIVMQGVLEHLDNPFTELKWMIDNLLVKGGDVITSSPCFLNPRGIVWMTLDMIGAVMSKTDLHYLQPYQFTNFATKYGYEIGARDCDGDWGNGKQMVRDLAQRIPLALRDGSISYNQEKLEGLLDYLTRHPSQGAGATMVYRIQT